MRKENIVRLIEGETGIRKSVVSLVIEAFMAKVKVVTSKGEKVDLRGFGSFKIIQRKEKKARNIKTGEQIILPAHQEVIFVKSKFFLDPTHPMAFENILIHKGNDIT